MSYKRQANLQGQYPSDAHSPGSTVTGDGTPLP
jgi:hypothetical protein